MSVKKKLAYLMCWAVTFMKNNFNNNVLYILPKYEKHMEYVLMYCLVLLLITENLTFKMSLSFACMKD